MIRRCRHGEIDLALLAHPVHAKYLETEALFDEELFLVVPSEHELASRMKVEPGVVDEDTNTMDISTSPGTQT